jgi:pyruvate dehydrogenase E1 component alpha subunit
VSSGIVGGIIPIALGVALDIKRSGGTNHVHCWMGDMTSETGIAYECIKYARNFDLPITFHIEDNGQSVCTDTRSAWGYEPDELLSFQHSWPKIDYSTYKTGKYPHAGSGERIQF